MSVRPRLDVDGASAKSLPSRLRQVLVAGLGANSGAGLSKLKSAYGEMWERLDKLKEDVEKKLQDSSTSIEELNKLRDSIRKEYENLESVEQRLKEKDELQTRLAELLQKIDSLTKEKQECESRVQYLEEKAFYVPLQEGLQVDTEEENEVNRLNQEVVRLNRIVTELEAIISEQEDEIQDVEQ